MSVSSARIRANRLNSRCSTGPRSAAGLARTSQNAVKVGLFSRLLVLPALGESVEEIDAFRSAVVSDLNPAGAVERELADRVAGIMWRLRRVARYEAAAMAVTVGELPPHPDAVAPLAGDGVYHSVPPDAPPAYRLAHLRARLAGLADAIAARRPAVAVLDADAGDRALLSVVSAGRVLDAAGEELGWMIIPDPWPDVLTAAGIKRRQAGQVEWTVDRLSAVLAAAAGTANRSAEEFRAAVRARLRAAVAEHERWLAEGRAEEDRLAAELLAGRERAAAARVYADEGLVQRVARAEGHLSRELDRTVALLARLRAERVGTPVAVRAASVLRNRDDG